MHREPTAQRKLPGCGCCGHSGKARTNAQVCALCSAVWEREQLQGEGCRRCRRAHARQHQASLGAGFRQDRGARSWRGAASRTLLHQLNQGGLLGEVGQRLAAAERGGGLGRCGWAGQRAQWLEARAAGWDV